MPTRAPVPNPIATSSSAIVALSQDDVLLRALTLAMLEQAAIVTSASIDRFVDQLAANSAQIAVIDAAAAPSPVAAFTQRLRTQFPDLLLVVVGPSALQAELSAQIADGTIFRFAQKPASAPRLKVFLKGAVSRLHQEREEHTAADADGAFAATAAAPLDERAMQLRGASWLQRLWRSS
jgi:DNA-binding NtrC family response regulator